MNLLQEVKTLWVVWVWNHTPHCAEMSRLASASLERPPGWKLRLKMWLHYLICVWCERYRKHLNFLHRAAPRSPEHLEHLPNQAMSREAKDRMKRRLRDAHAPPDHDHH
jgi:hypothetical protein